MNVRETNSESHASGDKDPRTLTICLSLVGDGGMSRASGRTMEQFTIHLNIGPRSKATFRLTYEEVLKRRLKQYDIVIKVKPKQLVQHFEVDRR